MNFITGGNVLGQIDSFASLLDRRLSTMRTSTLRPPGCLLMLICLGIAVRLGLGWLHSSDLTSDNDGYLAHAEMVANGEGFSGPYTHRPTAFRPPAYPIALAGLRWMGLSGSVCVAVVNGLCSLAVICFTWILCGQLQMTQRSAFIATAMTAFDPLLVRYTILPMTEVPTAAMLVAAMVALKAGDRRSAMMNKGVAGFGILAGVLFGIGSLVRPVLLVSCALLIASRLAGNLKYSSGWCRKLVVASLPMIAAVLTISPWIIRNAVHFGKFIPATTHGGYTLALGNNPDFYRDVINGDDGFPWKGLQLDSWQRRMIVDSAAQGVSTNDETTQDAWYYQQAIASIKTQPLSFLKACLLRLRRFWAITPGTDPGLPGLVISLIAVWYASILIGLVAAIGSSIAACCKLSRFQSAPGFRKQNGFATYSRLTDLWLVLLSFMLLHSIYWTDARMRAPVIPLICILATFGWNALSEFMVCAVGSRSSDDAGGIST